MDKRMEEKEENSSISSLCYSRNLRGPWLNCLPDTLATVCVCVCVCVCVYDMTVTG